MQHERINALELSSRRLWQLVSNDAKLQSITTKLSEEELNDAVRELARRRHYLQQLEEMGKLQAPSKS